MRYCHKHIAIVGSTGSGKSHSIAKILQEAIHCKNGEYTGLNNSHIVIFDIHSEYKSAFPAANYIDISTLVLPYWMLTSDELQELFIDTEVNDHNQRNIDLSGVPLDVLSITVSLISRILFEYGYYYKRFRYAKNPDEKLNNDVPLLLVYEEAHKYVPNSDLSRYRASKQSIERIAKESRKCGVTLLLSSQRPSEISETIFAQCNNFLALRLTNPNDQNYVKRLLPDTSGSLVEKMPSLKAGECILVGDAVTIPSIVHIEECDPKPSSNDIPYLDLWKTEWKELDISAIKDEWLKI